MSGDKTIFTAGLLASTIGTMTPMERAAGRYMRAPDHGADDGGFAEFAAAGEVEMGNAAEPAADDKGAGKGAAAAAEAKTGEGAGKEAAAANAAGGEAGEAGEGEGEAGEGEEEEKAEEEDAPKPKKKASERIRELNQRLRASERLRLADQERITAIEKKLLPAGENADSSRATEKAAPDPNDAKLYPLGHLDDRYIEDKLEWLAEQKAGAQADAVLHREQERERQAAAQQAQAKLLQQVDDLSTRGTEIYDDFQEAVVDSGLRGDWRLDQPTFEAAHEAVHGARILYELSQDKTEAARVASLSTFQQMKFVMDRDAEIAKTAKPRTKPGAGAPPETQTRGANSRTRPNASSDSLDEFEKAWREDEKSNN